MEWCAGMLYDLNAHVRCAVTGNWDCLKPATLFDTSYMMQKMCVKMVDQKLVRVQLYEEWMQADLEDGILHCVVTGNESQIY